MKPWPFLVAAMLLLLAVGMSEAEEDRDESSVEKPENEGGEEVKPVKRPGLKEKWQLAIAGLTGVAKETWNTVKDKGKNTVNSIKEIFGKKRSERRAL